MKPIKSFELFGLTITVRRVGADELPHNTVGFYDPGAEEILILKTQTSDAQLQTFLHEFYHAAFQGLGRNDLNDDEVIVDTLASLTHQMLKTAK